MRCTYCRWELPDGATKGVRHADGCPDESGIDEVEKKRRLAEWTVGYRLGRCGRRLKQRLRVHKTFVMGWTQGECALEEHENGYNPYAPGNDPGPEG